MPDTTQTAKLPTFSTVENCRYRLDIASRDGEETACCRLVRDAVDSISRDPCRVTPPVCEACCRYFPSTPEVWNPVVASLVYNRAQDAATSDQAARRALLRNAERFLDFESDIQAPSAEPTTGARSCRLMLREALPPPVSRSGPSVRHWAVGVTTAPRRRPTLKRCLDALALAGWPRPILFADGPVRLPPQFETLPMCRRSQSLGAWPSYYLSLHELLMREPLADAYMLVQDDALFYSDENVRQYLEQILWPGQTAGIVSLYCAGPYTRRHHGWSRRRGPWQLGALAFIFARPVALELVLAREVFLHRWSRDGLVGICDVIGAWAQASRTPVYFPTPSLVQHIGDASAIWPNAYESTAPRRASKFLGDLTADAIAGRSA